MNHLIEIPIIVDHDDVDIIVEKLRILLPKVTEHLREQNRLHEWVTFFSLVAEGKFNVGHLAAQLFFDVIRFNEAKSVHGMRFTENVKQFWRYLWNKGQNFE